MEELKQEFLCPGHEREGDYARVTAGLQDFSQPSQEWEGVETGYMATVFFTVVTYRAAHFQIEFNTCGQVGGLAMGTVEKLRAKTHKTEEL